MTAIQGQKDASTMYHRYKARGFLSLAHKAGCCLTNGLPSVTSLPYDGF
jgi:hypothetical protein